MIDRGTLLRMAGNIAAGMVALEWQTSLVIKKSVEIAEGILDEVESHEEERQRKKSEKLRGGSW
jgi:hypothetical protein